MKKVQRISPCLWFDKEAEAAANFYVSIFPNSRITAMSHYGEAGKEIHGMKAGTVLTVAFELDGQAFTAMNGGPLFKFNEAISLMVDCKDQAEVDFYWEKLSAGGNKDAQQCGWLKDRYGLSWQVVPAAVAKMMADKDRKKVDRVMEALLKMKKLDIAKLEKAFAG